jgi:hypothetical protein
MTLSSGRGAKPPSRHRWLMPAIVILAALIVAAGIVVALSLGISLF